MKIKDPWGSTACQLRKLLVSFKEMKGVDKALREPMLVGQAGKIIVVSFIIIIIIIIIIITITIIIIYFFVGQMTVQNTMKMMMRMMM